MFCEPYKQPLTYAALGGELTARLQEHLAACASCRAAFAEEQSLYAAIDSAVGAVANVEVPSTLVPRVHVALNNEPVFGRTPRLWIVAAIPVLAAMVLAFVYWPSHNQRGTAGREQKAANQPGPTKQGVPAAVNNSYPHAVSRERHDGRATTVRIHSPRAKLIEVIVEPEETAALLRYEAFLRERSASKSQFLLARTIELPPGIQPLEIGELEMRDLRIPALVKTESEEDMK